jgi:predicted phosphodiesterase
MNNGVILDLPSYARVHAEQRHVQTPAKSARFTLLAFGVACLVLLCGSARANEVAVLNADTSGQDVERFSFVIHGDLTGGERPGIFAAAAEQIALLQPDFVIGVGDLIEGDGEDRAALNREWDSFEARAGRIGRPVYLVGGNHDLTSHLQREVWRERYGSTYFHFRHGGALFLVLDTEDYSAERREQISLARDEAAVVAASEGWEAWGRTPYAQMPERVTGAVSTRQRDYFLEVLGENADARWIFLFMHKAPWESAAPGPFHDLEQALGARNYTVFHGHEHAQRAEKRRGRDYIRLATTGGVQLGDNGRAVDHLTLVTVGDSVSIATLDLNGIRTPSGELPAAAAGLCFDTASCQE